MKLALFALLLSGAVHAQAPPGQPFMVVPPCLYASDDKSLTASPLYSGLSKNGAWVRWYCFNTVPATRVEYVGLVSQFNWVGGHVVTIMNSKDQLKSLQTAGGRFTILPLTDPSLKGIVADMNAP